MCEAADGEVAGDTDAYAWTGAEDDECFAWHSSFFVVEVLFQWFFGYFWFGINDERLMPGWPVWSGRNGSGIPARGGSRIQGSGFRS